MKIKKDHFQFQIETPQNSTLSLRLTHVDKSLHDSTAEESGATRKNLPDLIIYYPDRLEET